MNCLKNNKGLSLIEIMVALGILAIVGAIAVPQFNRYRSDAGYQAQRQSLVNTANAFNVCMATKVFDSCDSLSELNINLPSENTSGFTQAAGGTGGNFCADSQSIIGGVDVRSCVSITGATGSSSITSNQRFCFNDGGAQTIAAAPNNCNSGAQFNCTTGYDTTCTSQCGDELTTTTCTDNAQCSGGCHTASNTGECDDSNGTCG